MLDLMRRLFARKPAAETPPEIDPDAQPIPPEMTRSFAYWQARDRRYSDASPDVRDGFAPGRWKL